MQRLARIREGELYRRAVLGVDEARALTIKLVGEATAKLVKLQIRCKQPDGTMIIFDLLAAGVVPTAVPGVGNLVFLFDPITRGDIQVENVGVVDGALYIGVIDDAGVTIGYWSSSAVVPVGGRFSNASVIFDMPMRDYGLTVEVGHL